ncbi:Hcp family type VI secretion system effector [Candidatus Venteria ishoeyi]|uniref:Phage major tail protein 2 n=1 Tax=Candidatus Venteria ishoeyi TaxID=1899563 RepID=A0A1H6FA28_9GAMM|nr:type VI secretion system tube protein Hcp [Candidatus Venteria ishoeyi]MDM8546330.1 type VI secretion system tube protein Hcp [Candidatus Venteria ishoeyi]SEH06947.1 Uncharacterised protein [Candidatus Venteria ishoeyi]
MSTHAYLKIIPKTGGPFEGNCKAKGHEKKIEISNWETSVLQSMEAEKQGEGSKKKLPKSTPGVMKFEKFYDMASDDLMKACWTGAALKTCTFEVFRSAYAGSQSNLAPPNDWFLQVVLEGAYISSYEIKGDEEEIPTETIDITYEGIQFKYKAIDKKTGELSSKPLSMTFSWATAKGG